MNGYKKHHPVGITVPAEMLETVAGYPNEATVDRELAFALSALDTKDADSLRWTAALMATKIDYLESKVTA